MPRQAGGGCCGCCDLALLTFDGSTVVGDYVDVLAGSWSIDDATDTLRTSSSNARVLSLIDDPGADKSLIVRAGVRAAAGDEVELYLDYVDADNYWIARFTFGVEGGIEILQRASGATTLKSGRQAALDPSETHHLQFWGGEGENGNTSLYTGVHTSTGFLTVQHKGISFEPSAAASSGFGGIGSASLGGEIEIDYLYFDKHYHEEEAAGCKHQPYDCLLLQPEEYENSGGALGKSWELADGSAEQDGALYLLSADALVLHRYCHPGGHAMRLRVTTKGTAAAGDELRIIFNAEDDQNYHYWQLRYGEGDEGRSSIYEVAAGVHTELAGRDTDTPIGSVDGYNYNVCVGGGRAFGGNIDTEISHAVSSSRTHARWGVGCGVNAGGLGALVEYYRGFDSDNDCYACGEACGLCDAGETPVQALIRTPPNLFSTKSCGGLERCAAQLNDSTWFAEKGLAWMPGCSLMFGGCVWGAEGGQICISGSPANLRWRFAIGDGFITSVAVIWLWSLGCNTVEGIYGWYHYFPAGDCDYFRTERKFLLYLKPSSTWSSSICNLVDGTLGADANAIYASVLGRVG